MKYAKLIDLCALPLAALAAPAAALFARGQRFLPRTRAMFDKADVALVRHHYYQPVVLASDLRHSLETPRTINGLNLNEAGQLALLAQFDYRDELLALPTQPTHLSFGYHNGSFVSGDAEYLYNMIRHFKPKRIIEVGCGQSTLLARRAIEQNRARDTSYDCTHICIEPFEQPWLEQLGIRIIREKVENCPPALFAELQAGDILFIDSSHVIRPQGDVVFEYLELLGALNVGVLIHVHDIFTPRDYPADWVLNHRRMWDEQYLLEAFLAFNSSFEVIGAVNWLNYAHRDKLATACPVLVQESGREPGSFWMRRVA